jgi:thymidylate kinase
MDTNRTPILVEFAGLPAAGKTTATNLLAERLRNRGLQITVVSESAAESPLGRLKRDWHFNAWTLCHTTQRLLEVSSENGTQFVIVDRGLFDAFCWIEWFKAKKGIPPRTAEVLQLFATLRDWLAIPHVVFCLSARFETSLKRRGHTGRIVNPQTFSELEAAYQAGLNSLSEHEKELVQPILTDDLSPDEVVGRVLHDLDARFRGFNA